MMRLDKKEMDEIVEIFTELESLNPRTIKDDNSQCHSRKLSVSSRNDTMITSPRKPSLPQITSKDYSKQLSTNCPKSNPTLSTRKSLFYYERSYSTTNVSVLKQDNLFGKYGQDKSLSGFGNSELSLNSNKLQEQMDNEIEIYVSFPTPILIDELDTKSPDLSQYMDLSSSIFVGMPQSTDIRTPFQRKNSIEILKMKQKRLSNQSHKDFKAQLQLDDNLYTTMQSAPESSRNSANNQSSYLQLAELSVDSGVWSGSNMNNLDSIPLQDSISNTQINSSGSCVDASDVTSVMNESSEMFFIETDNPKSPVETDSNIETNSKKEIAQPKKSVQSKEDQITFFKMISEDISMKSYSRKEIIRFNLPNGASSAQVIDSTSQAVSSVCALLKRHFNINPNAHWQIVEVIHLDSLERPLEDHENVLDTYYSWENENKCNQFIFRENKNMYTIFLKSGIFNNEMECDFEIYDTIWVKEANSRWKRVSCFISDSNVYFTTKPGSKDHRDLYCLVNLKKVDFYTCTDANKVRKLLKAPTNELIVFKSNKLEHKSREMQCLCALTATQKEKWIESMKVAKFSFDQLKTNYLNFEKKSDNSGRVQSHRAINLKSNCLPVNPSSV